MDIRYLHVEHERFEDAPFVGALISAKSCHLNCKDCFNQHLKSLPICMTSTEDLINRVKSNPFNEGIILGGLEWSEQPQELVALVESALKNNLKVMVFTGLSLNEFLERVPVFSSIRGQIYIKYGAYNESLKTDTLKMYGVKLASTNQKIELMTKC